MDLYNHLIFAAAAIAIALSFVKWYQLGLRLLLGLVTIDIAVHIFISLDLLRVFIAAIAASSIVHDLTIKRKAASRKIKIASGIFLIGVGLLILMLYPLPYFFIAGLVTLIFALRTKD